MSTAGGVNVTRCAGSTALTGPKAARVASSPNDLPASPAVPLPDDATKQARRQR